MKKFSNVLALFMALSLVFISCVKEDDKVGPEVKIYESAYVLNEGSENGSISAISLSDGTVSNGIFEKANDNVTLKKYPQSMALYNNNLLIVVTTDTGDGYIEVVDKTTLKHITSITGFSYPREITVSGNKAYVSNGAAAGMVYCIDLLTNKVVGQPIAVGDGPEKMVVSNGKLFVANSGGYIQNEASLKPEQYQSVSVIDLATFTLVKHVIVKSCPTDLVVDAAGKVWAHCKGVADYSNYPSVSYSNAALCSISLDYTVASYALGEMSLKGIKNIAISNDLKTIYYMTNGVYAMGYEDKTLPSTKLIDKVFNGIDINPADDQIWACDVISYTGPSDVVVYSSKGVKIATYSVGVIPNSVIFN